MTNNDKTIAKEELPFIAPSRDVGIDAPIRWLSLGLQDVRRAPLASLSYGCFMAILIMFVSYMGYRFGSAWIMLSMLCGFVFLAPLACIGTYAISAQLERNLPVSFKRTLRACLKRYIGTELVFTLVLLVVFLVWARASSMVSIFLPSDGQYQFGELTQYLIVLASVSLPFMALTFAASVFSLPMIMHRDVDAITAVVTSISAVLRNKFAMLVWGSMIAGILVLGIITGGVGLIVLLPAIGHAVWHGYLETIDAEGFPRHEVGITATRRIRKTKAS